MIVTTFADRCSVRVVSLSSIAEPERRVPPLPVPLTQFIERDREGDALRSLLQRDDVRLVTLTGPGGVGKTRLALRVAQEIASAFVDGVVFVPLAAVAEADMVPAALALALDVRDGGDRPLIRRLTAALHERQLLLVLDNFEHVLSAGLLVADLLASCPGLTVLATSRTLLHLSGEHALKVPPLVLPRAGPAVSVVEVGRAEAVRLFIVRARAAKPGFLLTAENAAPVADVCRRLEGLPLAIELAASRITVLPPRALLARLERRLPLLTGGPRDAPDRLRTMRDAIAWSYDLLDLHEQILFRRLAVFAGSFDLETAEMVIAYNGGSRPAVLDGVLSLTNASLLQAVDGVADRPRFVMLETIREFGLERAEASGETESARRAHALVYLDLAERGEAALAGVVESVWLDRLETDHDNLRAALAWTHAPGRDPPAAAVGLRLAGALWLFWYYHSHLTEGRRWLERALSLPGAGPDPARAKALIGLGTLAHFQGDDQSAQVLFSEGIELWRSLGDGWGTAFALTVGGNLAEDAGRYDEAATLFAEAHDLFVTAGDQANVAVTLYHLGVVAYGRRHFDLAAMRCEQALAIGRTLNDPWGMANALSYLGLIRCERAEFAEAASSLELALGLYREIGITERVGEVFRRLAVLAEARGEPATALRLFAAADVLAERIGAAQALPERATYARSCAAARDALDGPTASAAWSAGRAMSLSDGIAESMSMQRREPASNPPTSANVEQHPDDRARRS